MSNKIFIFIIVFIGCVIAYSLTISQIRSREVFLDKTATELEEKYAILENESNSIMEEIGSFVSMQNLNKIAKEKNLKKPNKEQIIELTNDKHKTK